MINYNATKPVCYSFGTCVEKVLSEMSENKNLKK